MASTLERQLAKCNGIVIPSMLPAGQLPIKPQRSFHPDDGLDESSSFTCPICHHAMTQPRSVRQHFVTCVKINGNPNGVRWDDDINSVSRPRLVKRERADSDKGLNNTNTRPATRRNGRPTTKEQRDQRQRRFYERLNAVNGVVIPSKLAPGELPVRRNSDTSGSRKYACPICSGLHNAKAHVQSHFPTCVATNGNPTGARWDDAWKGAGSRVGSLKVEDRETQSDQDRMQGIQHEESKPSDPRLESIAMEGLSLIRDQQSEQHSPPPPSTSLESHHSDFEDLDLELTTSTLNHLLPHDSDTRMGSLINEALLSMDHEWQGVIYYEGETYAMRHPHFQQTLKELESRGILDSDWVRIMDIEKVDGSLTRAMG